jgi:hypothetical protein
MSTSLYISIFLTVDLFLTFHHNNEIFVIRVCVCPWYLKYSHLHRFCSKELEKLGIIQGLINKLTTL